MKYIEILLISLAVALNYFRPAAEIGATQKTLPKGKVAIVGVAFGLVQLVVTGIGIGMALLIGLVIPKQLQIMANPHIVFVVLLLLGAYMINYAFMVKEIDESRKELPGIKSYIKTAAENIIISATACTAMYCVYGDLLAELLLAPAASLLLTAGGAAYGYWRGYGMRKAPYFIGGAILYLLAFKMILI